jgi:hypothetical protein
MALNCLTTREIRAFIRKKGPPCCNRRPPKGAILTQSKNQSQEGNCEIPSLPKQPVLVITISESGSNPLACSALVAIEQTVQSSMQSETYNEARL